MLGAHKSSGSINRKHGRLVSQSTRQSVKGPLDEIDDPLSQSRSTPPPQQVTDVLTSESPAAGQIETVALRSTSTLANTAFEKNVSISADLDFLRSASNYHALTTTDISPAFLQSATQPPADASLEECLQAGHFRRAASLAARELVKSNCNEYMLLRLLYVRLACLVLINRPDLAFQESSSLTEYLAHDTPEAKDLAEHVPWNLRLLLARLPSISVPDGGRRSILSLYSLASAVRARLRSAQTKSDANEITVLTLRLRDLGLRVADIMVEMGELETATRHLDSLRDIDPDERLYRKALIRLRIGDVETATACFAELNAPDQRIILAALIKQLDTPSNDAVQHWQSLAHETPATDALLANNLGVSLVYAGHVTAARAVLHDLAASCPPFSGLLFNLATVFELCTERAADLKVNLLSQLAAKTPSPASGGWERANYEVKL